MAAMREERSAQLTWIVLVVSSTLYARYTEQGLHAYPAAKR